MSLFFRVVTGLLLCASCFSAAQSADELAAEKVLGPHWKGVARAAGMIFTGTTLSTEYQQPTPQHPLPTVRARILVMRAIAGASSGQIVTIQEWTGAWSSQRPMSSRMMLLFFYPPSAAGLTSTVGGPVGQVPLDSSGKNVAARGTPPNARAPIPTGPRAVAQTQPIVSVAQLERAILRAREGK